MKKNIKETKQKLEKKENVKRKVIKVINVCSYVLSIIFILVFIVSCSMSAKNTNNNNDNNVQIGNKDNLILNTDITNPSNNDLDSFVNYNETKLFYVYDDNKKMNATPYGVGLFLQLAGAFQETYNIDNLGIISAYKDSNGWQHEFNIVRIELEEPYLDNIYINIYDEYGLIFTLNSSNNWGFTGQLSAQYFKFTNNDILYPYSFNEILEDSFSYMLYDNGDNYVPFYLTLAPYLEISNKVKNFDLRFKFSAVQQNVSVDIPPVITNTSKMFNGFKYENGGDITLHQSNFNNTTTDYFYNPYNNVKTTSNGGYKYDLKASIIPYGGGIKYITKPLNLNDIVCSNLIYKQLSKIGYLNGYIENRYYFNNLRYGDSLSTLVSVIDWQYGYSDTYSGIVSDILIDTPFGSFNNLTLTITQTLEIDDIYVLLINIRFGSVVILNAYFGVIQNGNNDDGFTIYDDTSDMYTNETYINKLDTFNDFGLTYKVSNSDNNNDNNLYMFLELFTNNTNDLRLPPIVGGDNTDIALTDTFDLIGSAFTALLPFLTIAILPNVTLGVLILVPLAISVLIFVFKMFKR